MASHQQVSRVVATQGAPVQMLQYQSYYSRTADHVWQWEESGGEKGGKRLHYCQMKNKKISQISLSAFLLFVCFFNNYV